MKERLKSFIALTIVVFIPFGLMIWFRTHQSTGFASTELIVYPLVFGGFSILVLALLKKYFLQESLTDFNSGIGSWNSDLVWGASLAIIYFIMFYLARITLSGILQFESNRELLTLMLDMRKSPLLLIIWFGPVLWIGISLFEELIRVFMLTSLWKWNSSKFWSVMVILLTSLLIGLTHWSQGSYGIVTIALKSLVCCTYFYNKRRLMPLIYAHVLYDGIQVGILLLTYPDQ